MKVVFLDQKQLRSLVLICIGLMIAAGFLLNSKRISRQVFGVKNGVRLEGRSVAGMLPGEVVRLVKALAERVNREPRNAGYFPETGEIIPAQSGWRVEVATTVKRVCLAKAGEQLRLETVEVKPQIREELFKPVYQGDPNAQEVSFAINVAWGEEHLAEMLKTLRNENVKATFFFVGTWVKAFPELVREIEAAGHEIANHGMYHGHPLQMNRDQLRRLITDNAALLAETIGRTPVKLFAPPYGEVNAQIAGTAGELGYRTIMWSVDTIDWKHPTPEALLERVLKKIEPGGIILMHPTIATRTALPILIRSLKKRNLRPVTISELLK